MLARLRLLVLWILVALAAPLSTRSNVLAKLSSAAGDVQRDQSTAVGAWRPARPGAVFARGDGLRTGANGTAHVRLRGGGAMKLEQRTLVRFVGRAPGGPQDTLRVETGEALVESGEQAVTVQTNIGAAVIEPGSALRLVARADRSTRFEVTFGAAHLETAGGGADLSPAHAIEVSVGGAILEPDDHAKSESAPVARATDSEDAGASAEPFVADVSGQGVRVQARGERGWKSLGKGQGTVSPGDTLEVPRGARVMLHRGAQSSTLVGDGRYVVGGAGGALVQAVRGHVDLHARDQDVVVLVPGGTIRARGEKDDPAHADVAVAGHTTTVAVSQGHVELQGQGAAQMLRAGDTGTLDAHGTLGANAMAAERADFGVPAGESFTVRDPHPPTAVGFDLARVCPSGGVVAVDAARVRGEARSSVLLSAGVHDYAVHCLGPGGVDDATAARGRVVVLADSGLAPLPRQAPSTLVDADGRRYTVLYQNLLPAVDVRWPNAPAAPSYLLHVDAKSTPMPRADGSLRAGSVGEGTHRVWFETSDGAKHSESTTLVLRFDNAAPTASVQEPANKSFHAGETVHVSGVALDGWLVTVGGRELALDGQKRFAGDCTVPATDAGMAVRLVHPTRGIVYYVRHASGGH